MSGPRLPAFGAEPKGERLRRIERSPHYDATTGAFRNPGQATTAPRGGNSRWKTACALLSRKDRRPSGPVPVRRPDLTDPPATGLRLTWLGHSTVLTEIDGRRVLFDPVWGERCSPFTFVGPRRYHPAPLPLGALGGVDVVVVSHDHYDHLDMPTVRALARSDVHFAVPLGVGAHLERWGLRPDRLTELDWHESTRVAGLTLTATPARHFCGRGLRNRQRTLWASWVVAGPDHRVFHSGDTGYFPGFADTGSVHGPFDATMIQVGAYSDFWPENHTGPTPLPGAWPDIHMSPAQGVQAHLDLHGGRPGGVLLPIHWGTFNLAPHPWTQPGEWMMDAAEEAGQAVAFPCPGQSFEPAGKLPSAPWWRAVAQPIAHPWRRPGPAPVSDEARTGDLDLAD